MTLVARLCVSLLELSSRMRVPSRLDRRAASIAMHVVGVYRKVLSAKAGRSCLFRRSCSHATLDFLAEFGWNDGIVRARDRVRSCGGTYTLSKDVFGRTALITAEGRMFGNDELSDAVACRCGSYPNAPRVD
jgi:putative component of membrane protein insertase Oxa1/YidC/SpoIIIJ protein YidD